MYEVRSDVVQGTLNAAHRRRIAASILRTRSQLNALIISALYIRFHVRLTDRVRRRMTESQLVARRNARVVVDVEGGTRAR